MLIVGLKALYNVMEFVWLGGLFLTILQALTPSVYLELVQKCFFPAHTLFDVKFPQGWNLPPTTKKELCFYKKTTHFPLCFFCWHTPRACLDFPEI